jgi:thymidylate synthase ThyX
LTIEARIIADSVNPVGNRLTTFVCKYPRFIHSEVMTHRMLSRNASSSRAIPVHKMIQAVIDEPAMPVYWGAEQKGMQSGSELDPDTLVKCQQDWLDARNSAVDTAKQLTYRGLHKSLVNRIIEPWAHITVVVSATEWANFFALRCHKDAQPEFQVLANLMAGEYKDHEPDKLNWGRWHLPFISDEERFLLSEPTLIKCSVARCARVSYLTHDGANPSVEKDIELHDKLVIQTPAHASPAEHPACASMQESPSKKSNFKGFLQYRKMLVNENITRLPWATQPAEVMI